MIALKALPTRTFGLLMSLEPTLSGLVILKEQLTLVQWVAIACVILASMGSAATARKPVLAPEAVT